MLADFAIKSSFSGLPPPATPMGLAQSKQLEVEEVILTV
jgi:hypothetical protein